MIDYISRDAAIEKIRVAAGCAECDGKSDAICCCAFCDIYNAIRLIKSLPAADVAEVMHGRWISDAGFFCCSRCEYEWEDSGYKTPFCPECGAKMDLDGEILDLERSGEEGNSYGI